MGKSPKFDILNILPKREISKIEAVKNYLPLKMGKVLCALKSKDGEQRLSLDRFHDYCSGMEVLNETYVPPKLVPILHHGMSGVESLLYRFDQVWKSRIGISRMRKPQLSTRKKTYPTTIEDLLNFNEVLISLDSQTELCEVSDKSSRTKRLESFLDSKFGYYS
jgi:hypothetical protein